MKVIIFIVKFLMIMNVGIVNLEETLIFSQLLIGTDIQEICQKMEMTALGMASESRPRATLSVIDFVKRCGLGCVAKRSLYIFKDFM